MIRFIFYTTVYLLAIVSLRAQSKIIVIVNKPSAINIDKVDFFDISQLKIQEFKYADTLEIPTQSKYKDLFYLRYHQGNKKYTRQFLVDTGVTIIHAQLNRNQLLFDTVIHSKAYYERMEFENEQKRLVSQPEKRNEYLLDIFKKNVGNPYSLVVADYFIIPNQNNKPELKKLQSLSKPQGEQFKWHMLYDGTLGRLHTLINDEKINISNYIFLDPSNSTVKVKLSGAKFFVLDFWTLYTKQCLEDQQSIKAKTDVLKSIETKVIGICIDDHEVLQAFLLKNPLPWENYRMDAKNNLDKYLHLANYPTYIILNSSGEILGYYNTIQEVFKYLKI